MKLGQITIKENHTFTFHIDSPYYGGFNTTNGEWKIQDSLIILNSFIQPSRPRISCQKKFIQEESDSAFFKLKYVVDSSSVMGNVFLWSDTNVENVLKYRGSFAFKRDTEIKRLYIDYVTSGYTSTVTLGHL